MPLGQNPAGAIKSCLFVSWFVFFPLTSFLFAAIDYCHLGECDMGKAEQNGGKLNLLISKTTQYLAVKILD